ncbi:AAEL012905-PA [Aedes aegypti]|uniref:AAEL012905-PA n=1 Tax=Aedes aegypti TaxID=7159 RepID=Q16KQ8_AEDAE|nr:AAEL012905-PA [Aedes aegypti]
MNNNAAHPPCFADIPKENQSPCVPSPCGANAICREQNGAGSCTCIEDHFGNPYEGCRPECVLNSDCPTNRACIRNRCQDPCPGTCGQSAECQVVNHLPSCTCIDGYEGDPFRYCHVKQREPIVSQNPCMPSPCGPNSQCREINEQAVCSCLPTYIGSPPGCRPECVTSSECSLDRACINQKCVDPCPGTCAANARCNVNNHSPICSCRSGYTGDPFTRCYPNPPPPQDTQIVVRDPCVPSPCGPNSQCRNINGVPSCSCLVNYIGSPPNCRPDCTINAECPSNQACMNEKCRDPCPGSCGIGARCNVINHTPICTCEAGYTGDPFTNCYPEPPPREPVRDDPCNPSPCGPNAQCNNGICTCLPEYQGDPYQGCRPECVLNSDCPRDRACIRSKCIDPCPGTCGQDALCEVINHIPMCSCPNGMSGNAFVQCRPQQAPPVSNPCNPSPCGPNSQCREINGQAVCSCVPGFIGSPPTCRPECVVSSECPQNQACNNQKCRDPCPGTCGVGARCAVVNHNPICSCPERYTGDPFIRCQPIIEPPVQMTPVNPCQPSPCGPNAECRPVGDSPSCTCLDNMIGSPPNCRPECVSNTECASNLACIRQKCQNPCAGACGANAECRVVSHTPMCICSIGFTGDPFTQCVPVQQDSPREPPSPCVPSPCGANAICRERNGAGSCACIDDHFGNPYEGCRPECVLNSDCPSNRACVRNKCQDPCPGTCGQNAECQVVNHLPSCTCLQGYEGDPFRFCNTQQRDPIQQYVNPCQPSPCGPNSQCREINGQGVCSCLPTYIGSPPGCRPECVTSSECSLDKACVNQKCVDPCPGTCGTNARCNVNNHSPICSCQSGYTGDPFTRCYPNPPPPQDTQIVVRDPCVPSPCGPNSQCRNINGVPSCSCLVNYIGSPPNCRPECSINAECPSNQACMNEKCRDPCPGSCGVGARCNVINHTPTCTCEAGYTGDPFTNCYPEPPPREPVRDDPCNPSPCGPNAQCNDGICTCLPEYQGDPYQGCRPECVLNSDCPRDRACIRSKCIDPCPGTCGQDALCEVINHIPMCSCPNGMAGNAFVQCRPQQAPPVSNPCNPSPCGPNSQCREIHGQAVCSCVPGFIGSPPTCRPECVVSSECPQNQACNNQKCRDPCPGTCGVGARCSVVNHNPICSCPERYTGDPFIRCQPIIEPPVQMTPVNPCQPSPCGPNAECRPVGDSPSCTCLDNMIGSPPNCRPECVSNSECASNLACIRQKCQDPCTGACGSNAECRVVSHTPMCICSIGFTGDPFTQCVPVQQDVPRDPISPCIPSPCGANAVCREQNGAGSCICVDDHFGNPYEGCRPECVLNSDCPSNRACVRNKCQDPCPGTCGQNADCQVVNHLPSCTCFNGYEGDPFKYCNIQQREPVQQYVNPCQPSPCGPNSQCREINGQAVCSCLPTYIGSPPGCRPECVTSSECSLDKACVNQKCVDPCPGTCGTNARCNVNNHSPICSCQSGYTGDPFTRCYPNPPPPQDTQIVVRDPCVPSPCGPNSQCRNINGVPSCSCLVNYIGSPPNCRPECTINAECPSNQACMNEKCRDPCPGSCGVGARCNVINHTPICTCEAGYTGDPFTNCYPEPPPREPVRDDPCNPSPCGPNAQCNNGICTCLPEYQGDPYQGCRPECVLNSDCPRDRACIRSKCIDPCPGTCGQDALCEVINHIPMCSCPNGMAGNAFVQCRPQQAPPVSNPCNPSPCGPNSQCREINGQAVCSCVPGYIGSPPTCRPECVVSSECPQNQACNNQKCRDPCPGTCGVGARCSVVNHNPICSCPERYTGDPFIRCQPIIQMTPVNPCQLSPCGPNAECRPIGDSPSCTCLDNMIGSPPNCRPECISNSECASNLACIRQKCQDPCTGACGANAECRVVSHTPMCICSIGFTGDPFTQCVPVQQDVSREPTSPCTPSPCGANAVCREQNGAGSCTCIEDHFGNPYEGCRPECVLNSDCPSNRACVRNKCQDPCPGTCGQNAECQVVNHLPSCTCIGGYEGDPFRYCSIQQREPQVYVNPCQPSPCGPNSQCREINGQGVCSCLPTYIGSPPGCRPECVTSSECSLDKACVNQKCVDPCPGTCGTNARCNVNNHSPICSCQSGYTGDPFTRCYPNPPPPQDTPVVVRDPCVPSPCGPNAQCRNVNGVPSCSCLVNYIGAPPNCRPECTINAECPSNQACMNEKCRDPCPGSCGVGARCNVINHTPICTCEAGYTGDPFTNCYPEPPPREPERDDPCNPSPCGSNAQCNNGICTCLPEYQGDPYQGCRPECVLNTDCPRDKACIRSKCVDPCPGTCGQNAVCEVLSHIPICSCPNGMAGNAFVQCRPQQDPPVTNPCNPSPCGPNSQCREINGQAVCSCVPGFIGSPPACRPECVVSSECAQNQACSNQKCRDPCPGTCGVGAHCTVVNHSPICSCPDRYTGDPFVRCQPILETPVQMTPKNPCQPNPCGPNAECRTVGDLPSCTCLDAMIGAPPNCRPECVNNAECSNHLACIRRKCQDPCAGACGVNSECQVVSHTPNCICSVGFTGDPFTQCLPVQQDIPREQTSPCLPNPCGSNAICREQNGAGACTCIENYYGNPYEGCRPECVLNSDCPSNRACVSSKCKDPCPGTCGQNAECQVVNHLPSCTCFVGYEGDPFRYCNVMQREPIKEYVNPCQPNPCGPNSQCREINGQAVCSCLPTYGGSPPGCRPECVTSSECSLDKACVNQKCVDPCPGTCGTNARCNVNNHSPICSCQSGYTGDPFTRCYPNPPPPKDTEIIVRDPCVPSPCGPNAQCRNINGAPSCSCHATYIGTPPNCRPECSINAECPSNQACINEKCRDPCPGSCGIGARCNVINHTPICTCQTGYTGDPFTNCYPEPAPPREPTRTDPCDPSPCGANAQCSNGVCTCLPEYQGDPYRGCRPECVLNSECPRDKACIRSKCVDPCPGTCGQDALCEVMNHIPVCSCPNGMAGNAFIQCMPQRAPIETDPCNPSPCGPNSQCRQINGQAVCSCVVGYVGSPPSCRPECSVNSDCVQSMACVNFKCKDPCPGTCGLGAQCTVVNHNPICSCRYRMTGDPFVRCYEIVERPVIQETPRDPCIPSPCGLNSVCVNRDGTPSCSCQPEMIGSPPNCRPECISNSDCSNTLACINQKCQNPCSNVCGTNAECRVSLHVANCICPSGYTGNPFVHCSVEIATPPPPRTPEDPCDPSPCGTNARCRPVDGSAVCECIENYFGNAYVACRPECVSNSECSRDTACIQNRCKDPCPGVCGYNAECSVINHTPTCTCPEGMVGNAFEQCSRKPTPPVRDDPCYPSPCGLNTVCRSSNGNAVCECLPDFKGTPFGRGCYPECTINSDCPRDRTCVNKKCVDPCPGVCGYRAVCHAINNSPVCSCPSNMIGDPFVECKEAPPKDPCNPSPCRTNGVCRVVGGRAECQYPECVINSDCSSNRACYNQKCRDPCAGACGVNAICNVVNHSPVCSCPERHVGSPFVQCIRQMDPIPQPECTADDHCTNDKACINQQCVNPCTANNGLCNLNAECRVQFHRAICTCREGYTGNAQVACYEIGCRADSDCPATEACVNRNCVDPCKYTQCGRNAVCRTDYNHNARCHCLDGYRGNPLTGCTRPECTRDDECPYHLSCQNEQCRDPCNCAPGAQCRVDNHRASCRCPPGYTGDASFACEKGCSSDVECAATETCRNRVCVNPCTEFNPCARSAECLAQSHKAICSCPIGMVGDPFQNCYREPVVTVECTVDTECASDRACINQRCQDPCAEGNPCAGNAECRTLTHRPLCMCPRGWGGDPTVQCYKPECQSDNDCPYDKACYNEKCLNPCTYGATQCGRGAECLPQGHRANCVCPQGTQGNPLISCVTGLCQYNEDCADHEACDRLNRVCRPVCDDETCAAKAMCVGRNHQATCECSAGTRGNPYIACLRDEPEPECRADSDCPSQQACLNSRCDNPCTQINPCSQQQTCSVVDTLPLRTMICACPSDMLVDDNGQCKPIVVEGCRTDGDCPDTDRCIRGQCTLACRAEPCGINSLCESRGHQARCACPPEYIGNPHIECTPEARVPSYKECTVDSECPLDRSCFNERCINPCTRDACGRGAICHVQNHNAVCNCPTGYTKDRNDNCIPPSADLPKCQSNSDCTSSETCVNEICANPCNCGQNADCYVKDHYPVCSCKPGYSGNAQFGCFKLGCSADSECANDKQCFNGECLNPCALENPCALNAECYGDKHRAVCRCMAGLEGNPFVQCRRVECHFDGECPDNRACVQEQCVDPCSAMAPCAQNAICFTRGHAPHCKCPDHLPDGNPFSYCERRVVQHKPECTLDVDCPSRLACINNKCVDPCRELLPCAKSAKCTVLDSVPVRTMVCECPELHVPDANGECKRIVLQTPPECTSDSECSESEACINRQCRNPCNCGENAMCTVKNHRGICSCDNGFEGNPNIACRTIGCRVDSECESSKACINGNCVNPCLDNDPCGINAECYTVSNRAECRCLSGYRGNPMVQCTVVECRSNNDCPNDKQCRNTQCVDPCIYDSSCSPRAECKAQNHLAVCRCPPGLVGNPYVDCRPEIVPECVYDTECPSHLACIENKCVEPCGVLQPCNLPARCEAIPSSPVRTMICVCPDGYVSSGSGTCKPVVKSGCISDSDCSSDTACINSICRNPCNCGPNAECRIKDHKPVCSCKQGFDGNPEIECVKIECRADDDCSGQHSCINRQCVPVCSIDSCGKQAECYAQNHRAICECMPGYEGDPRISCKLLGCRADSECPLDKACINGKCDNPCEKQAICAQNELCQVYQHRPECACPPPFESDPIRGCVLQDDRCRTDGECPSQTACIQGECVNPCNVTEPCGVNSMCKVLDTLPVRTMICECLPGYQGNAAIQCDKMALCPTDRGFIRNANGECACPPGYGLSIYEDCQICRQEDGLKVEQAGRCVCALERGMIIDERGRCICPIDHGYRLTERGECVRTAVPECTRDSDCPVYRYCNEQTRTCEDPCTVKHCGTNALCNATNHQAVCQCIAGYTGNPELHCNQTTNFRTDFPQPDMQVTCQADGVQVVIDLMESNFNGVLYVKGHSKDEECRRVVNLAGDASQRTQIFKVHFGSCGLIHVNGVASFILVIQKHPKLVTYKAQAYHIKCVYQTGEKNVTLGFNVQMLTTAGTIANTGPPPTCAMRIVAYNGEEINSAEIGDNLRLQVEVQPATIYGGFARSCVAKTMEDSVENEYIVTDENGCATEPSIFGDWEYQAETNSLLASFNAFKFPSSDNIRFQCNIRVCFGRCQPVNCHGANAYGKRRRRAITDMNEIEMMLNRTRRATSSNTALASDDTLGIEGTLREEITIQSNAILTLERREERSYDSDNITPAAQRVEDICVSMIGLIIALVITALLALVAVAVAVSCWLMAYRRRPTVTGPLPHPPEFPNPLFAHHEPSEPSHDYMT